MKRVGIFDSGVGGVTFAKHLKKIHPNLKIKVVRDTKNMPYGNKSPRAIEKLTEFSIQPILSADVIVLACNTATAYAIDYLRSKYPNVKFVGFEPALKTARSYTKTDAIAVLATPATLKSSRYKSLKQAYGEGLTIYEPNVSTLAAQIEHQNVSWPKLTALLQNLVNQHVDSFVLGCTHYHLVAKQMQQIVGNKAKIIAPTDAVIRQIDKTLKLSS